MSKNKMDKWKKRMLDGLVQGRKRIVKIDRWLERPFENGLDSPLSQFCFFLVLTFSRVAFHSFQFVVELPIHVWKHPTESFTLFAERGPGQTFLDSYSQHLQRYRLAVASSLAMLLVLVGQLYVFGWALYQTGRPQPALAATISVSGSIFTDEPDAALSCFGDTKTVAVSVNGGVPVTADCTGSGGTFTVGGVNVSAAGDVLTVFLDGEAEDAVTVTRVADAVTNITGLDLIQNRVVVRHEDAGPTSNANLGQYDNNNDLDIPFTSNANSLIVNSGTELHIWSGKTFDPGGDVDTNATGGDLHIDDGAIVEIDTATSTIGRDVLVDAGSTFRVNANTTIDGGDLTTETTGTITTTAGTPTLTINGTGTLGGGSGTITVHSLTFGSGTHTLGSSFTVNNDLTLAGSITAGSTTVTMVGTAGTLVGGGMTLNNLTINPSSAGTITLNTSDVAVAGALVVASGDVLSLSASRILTNSGATDVNNDGTISGAGTLTFSNTSGGPDSDANSTGTYSSVIRFDATGGNIASTTIDARTYSGKVELYSNSTAARSVTLASGTYTLSGASSHLQVIAANTADLNVAGDTNNPTVTIGGDLDFTGTGDGFETISAGTGTWTVSGNVDFTNGFYGPKLATLTPDYANTAELQRYFQADIGCALTNTYSCLGSGIVRYWLAEDAASCIDSFQDRTEIDDRGWMEYNATGISDTATILSASLGLTVTSTYSANINVARSTQDDLHNASCAVSTGTFSKIGGAVYGAVALSAIGNKVHPLGTIGAADVQSRIDGTTDRLSLGLNTGIFEAGLGSVSALVNTRPAVYIGYLDGGSPTLVMNGSGKTLTSAGNGLHNVNLSSTITLANEVHYIGGDLNLTSGDITPGTSTVYMTGVGKTLTAPAAGDTLANLTIDPPTLTPGTITLAAGGGDLTASGVLTVATGDTLSIGAARTLSATGTTTLNGTISGSGTLRFTDTSSGPGTTGTLSVIVRYDASAADIAGTTFDTRTYSNQVELYSNSGVARVVNCENSTATYTLSGVSAHLHLYAAGAGNLTLNCNQASDPVLTIGGDLDYMGAGGGTEIISSGPKTYTISGNADFSVGTYTAVSGNKITMNGLNKFLVGNDQAFYDVTVDPTSGSTITFQTSSLTVTHDISVHAGDTMSISSGVIVSHTGASEISWGDSASTISGAGTLRFTETSLGPGTGGTLSSVVRYDATGGNIGSGTVDARTYNGAVQFYENGIVGRTITFPAGTMDLNGSMTIEAQDSGSLTVTGVTNDPAYDLEGDFSMAAAGGTETFATGSGNWNAAASVDLTNGTYTTEGTHKLIMDGTGTLTSDDETLFNLDINSSGTVTLAAATHTLTGNLLLGGSGTPTVAGSTINMTGSAKTIQGGYKAINHLTITDNTTAQTSGLTVGGTLTVAASKTLTIDVVSLTNTGSSEVVWGDSNSTITSPNGGNLIFTEVSGGPGIGGMLSAITRFTATNGDVPATTFDARTYSSAVVLDNLYDTTSNHAIIASGSYILSGSSSYLSFQNNSNTYSMTMNGATNNPTFTIGGDLNFGGDGLGARIITSGTSTWTVSGNVDFTSGTYTATNGNTLLMNGAAKTLTSNTSSGSALYNLALPGSIILANATHYLNGDLNLAGGTITAGTSTITMQGSANTITGSGQSLNNLTIDPSSSGTITLQTSNLTVTNNLTLQAGDHLAINPSITLTHTGANIIWGDSASTISGAGTLRFTNASGGPGTGGTLSAQVRYDASTSDLADTTVDARTYGGDVEFYISGTAANRIITLGAGTFNLTGSSTDFLVSNQDGFPRTLVVTGAANIPTLNIGGNLDFTTTNGGCINSGTGTWTISGNMDLRDTTCVQTLTNMVMDGASKTLYGSGKTIVNLIIAGTITQPEPLIVSGGLTVNNGAILTVSNALTSDVVGSITIQTTGAITGTGPLVVRNSNLDAGNPDGTLSTNVRFDPQSTTPIIMPARTYAGSTRSVVITDESCIGAVTLRTAAETVTVEGTLTVDDTGCGLGATLDADTNDTTINVGDMNVATGGTTTLSMGSGVWTASGNFNLTNLTTLNHNGGTLVMSGVSKALTSAGKMFNNLSITGNGITVADSTTTAGDVVLGGAAVFTMTSGQTLTVGGNFTNQATGANTTWTGATLYLNGSGGTYEINTKTSGSDFYNILRIGASEDAAMWTSDATTITIDAGGSLLSQDHAGLDGRLQIYGAANSRAGEFWSQATDFDGVSLGSPRQVDVRLADGASFTVDAGDTLNLIGNPSFPTLITRQSTGGYGITNSGVLNARYFNFQFLNAAGLNMTSTASITQLSDGIFDNSSAGSASYITLTGLSSTETLSNLLFDPNSDGVDPNANFNISADGAGIQWTMLGAAGNKAGESFDQEVNGASIVWGDGISVVNDGLASDIDFQSSTSQISANWAAGDPTGIDHYEYAIGTSAGGTQVSGYDSTSLTTSVTRGGLSLTAGQTYFVTVRAINAASEIIDQLSSDGVLIDTQAASFTNIVLSSTETSITATWLSTEETTQFVAYGVTTAYGTTTPETTNLTTSHSQTITGLTPGTTYHLQLGGHDRANNITLSADQTITTQTLFSLRVPPAPTLRTPIIRHTAEPSMVVTGLTRGGTTVRIYLGTTIAGSTVVPGTGDQVRSFAIRIELKNFKAGTYRVGAQAINRTNLASPIRYQYQITVGTVGPYRTYLLNRSFRYIVQRSDSLWRIARTYLGSGARYPTLVQANRLRLPSLVTAPSIIYPGWLLIVPR